MRGRLLHPETINFVPRSAGINRIEYEFPADIECDILEEPKSFPDLWLVRIKYDGFIVETCVPKSNIKITMR